MRAMMRSMMVLGMAVAPAMVAGQGHDVSKMSKDTTKKPMAGTNHEMGGMKGMSDSAMKGMMKNMKPGSEMTGWKELDALHAQLMATWHGAMDNDLRPAKAMSGDVVKAADALVASKGPACDTEATHKQLAPIAADAKAYADVVAKKGSDADIKAALKKVHDGFEAVMKPCMKAKMGGMKEMKH